MGTYTDYTQAKKDAAGALGRLDAARDLLRLDLPDLARGAFVRALLACPSTILAEVTEDELRAMEPYEPF